MRPVLPLMLLLAGCALSPKRPAPEQMAFPFGTYQHKVTATPKSGKMQKPVELSGVVQSREHDLRVVGLSPVGSTVFRMHEDLCEGKITKEFYVEELKKQEGHLDVLYQMVKAALFAPKDRPDFMYRGAHIQLSEPDEKGIPRKIELDHPYIDIKIDVTGYQVANRPGTAK
jgi:hypothetical protein